MSGPKLTGIEKSDFTHLKKARAEQINREFDELTGVNKIASNKELDELEGQEKTEREELMKEMGKEKAEVVDMFLDMSDGDLHKLMKQFDGMARPLTAGEQSMYHIAVQVLCKRCAFDLDNGGIDGLYGTNETKGTRKAVFEFQTYLNATFKTKLTPDGYLGPKTLKVILDNWDDVMKRVPSNSNETEDVKIGSKVESDGKMTQDTGLDGYLVAQKNRLGEMDASIAKLTTKKQQTISDVVGDKLDTYEFPKTMIYRGKRDKGEGARGRFLNALQQSYEKKAIIDKQYVRLSWDDIKSFIGTETKTKKIDYMWGEKTKKGRAMIEKMDIFFQNKASKVKEKVKELEEAKKELQDSVDHMENRFLSKKPLASYFEGLEKIKTGEDGILTLEHTDSEKENIVIEKVNVSSDVIFGISNGKLDIRSKNNKETTVTLVKDGTNKYKLVEGDDWEQYVETTNQDNGAEVDNEVNDEAIVLDTLDGQKTRLKKFFPKLNTIKAKSRTADATGDNILEYHNGNIYFGEFKNGQASGQVSIVYHEGDTYQGKYSNDNYNGTGVYTDTNGKKEQGTRENGELLVAA